MARNLSLLSTAGFLTLVVAAAGAFRLIPDEPMNAQINPLPSPLAPISKLAKISPDGALAPVHPDEPTADTLNQRFTLENSLTRLQQINAALTSFRQLTEKTKTVEVGAVGNTDWETQNLGFPNWTTSVEGTLRRQHLQIKQLERELARKQYADREISKAALEKKQAEYQQAERDFQNYWNSVKIAD
ncbi:hypothetical protein BST81_03895 [Leptolyngbya sp. 'hensonii']|uniref:hypothetical protein n=1 Tax=Leptolyngbya sp. 'hensonii' TaxID=1922337 RepID=UPI00094F524E|nr:hypothetical protein [Leptolyngbya sp. 'hensonii']OLP19694.1 hypothetical protein BST81_03895 [Leptolyngbya sp. 'hensonii']